MKSGLGLETTIREQRSSSKFIGRPSYNLVILGGHDGWLTFALNMYPFSYHPIKKRRLELVIKLASNDWIFNSIKEEYEETKKAIVSSRKLSTKKFKKLLKVMRIECYSR